MPRGMWSAPDRRRAGLNLAASGGGAIIIYHRADNGLSRDLPLLETRTTGPTTVKEVGRPAGVVVRGNAAPLRWLIAISRWAFFIRRENRTRLGDGLTRIGKAALQTRSSVAEAGVRKFLLRPGGLPPTSPPLVGERLGLGNCWVGGGYELAGNSLWPGIGKTLAH